MNKQITLQDWDERKDIKVEAETIEAGPNKVHRIRFGKKFTLMLTPEYLRALRDFLHDVMGDK